MSRTRSCTLCGSSIGQNVAAHDCPHGEPCRYLADEAGMPVDWKTPGCSQCRGKGAALHAVPSFALTDKALDVLTPGPHRGEKNG